jgi:hypothetical protein
VGGFRYALSLLLGASVIPVSAQTIRTLDLSGAAANSAAANKKFYVIFAARGGSATGHAFVMWGVEDSVQKRSTIRAFGLYPESDQNACRSAFGRIAGTIVDESVNHSMIDITDELIVKVDENYFDRSLQIARHWECKHEFELLSRDCVEFVRAVGNSLYIEMPRRTILQMAPRAYVRALMASVTTGTLTLPDAVYEGSLVNNRPMGRGVLTFQDESRIDGSFWGLDHLVGSGILHLASGYRYEGAIINYKAHGAGRLLSATDTPVLTGRFESGELKALLRDHTPDRAYSRHRNTMAERVAAEFGRIEALPAGTARVSRAGSAEVRP